MRLKLNEEWTVGDRLGEGGFGAVEEHFDTRKVELGTCGRPCASDCRHEHACIRCPVPRVNPQMAFRLEEIETDLISTCRPRPLVPCPVCSKNSPVCARWPLGPVCKPCYALARREPGPCPCCSTVSVLIARVDGQRACGPCAGHPDPYVCPRCGGPSSPVTGDSCDRCAVRYHLEALLHGLPPEKRPLN
ncbi:hypothetical protein ADK53_05010 [Streptomyces sp. WM6373]|uniref:hypothetical protein n=1 Tax=Streptomyces sp. WM6373 TaxID=1415556 RepID=UPI0006ADDE0D|nr:hypothetical protein [Streptomyces sp. WM6373]KOU43671.1 hypothetical protein ADK53_05010 [Streptomyces sp. WM6373]